MITLIIRVQLCQNQIVQVSLFSICFEKVQLLKNENITLCFLLKLMSTWKSEAFCLQKIILIFSFVTLLYFRYFRYHKFIAFLLKRLLIFRYVDQSTSTHLTAVHYPLVFIVNRILPGGKLPRCQFINYIYTTNPNSGNQFVDWNS